MKLQSSRGMVVEMSDQAYGTYLAKYGSRTRESILTEAGRVYKHRELLHLIRKQELTEEQKLQVESLATAAARQFAIYNAAREMGYGTYVDRALQGRIMPDSWCRIVERAAATIEEITVTESDRNCAMTELGFYVERDAAHSARIVRGCESWKITVPDGWGGDAMKSGAPLGFDIH